MRRLTTSPGLTFSAVLLVVGLLSLVAVSLPPEPTDGAEVAASRRVVAGDDATLVEGDVTVHGDSAESTTAGRAGGSGTLTAAKSGTAAKAATGGKGGSGGNAQGAALACKAGQNGGNTDIGVTATEIKLASTVVQSGVGASFLADSPKAMQAVVQKVNRQGGICGRLLRLKVVDDGWNDKLGLNFIRNFIESKEYFALPVVPSSEGLTAAIEAKDISTAGIPVVGSDGMLRQQYQDKWVWPVATATESTMRAMAKFGYDQGARTFGIVYDSQYRFGKEGADAFKAYVESLGGGAAVKAFVGIRPGESSYGSEVERFNGACNPCDMVAMLLEPATAETWVAGRPTFGKVLTSGAQTLFNRRFASNCRAACHDMLVWTGYNPPIDALAGKAGVNEFVNDVQSVDPGIDTTNAFVEGAYLGMTVFVEALRRVGPNLTRAALRAELDKMTFEGDLASTLQWTPERRNANIRAQAFSLQYAGDSFSGFRNEQTGWIADPVLAR
ncbi:MAG: ABC transporter substrate-binding protein [Actinomycetota bacterium]|nr:ABC transporter substrate-binding protein [Actinomycetota bacterium]